MRATHGAGRRDLQYSEADQRRLVRLRRPLRREINLRLYARDVEPRRRRARYRVWLRPWWRCSRWCATEELRRLREEGRCGVRGLWRSGGRLVGANEDWGVPWSVGCGRLDAPYSRLVGRLDWRLSLRERWGLRPAGAAANDVLPYLVRMRPGRSCPQSASYNVWTQRRLTTLRRRRVRPYDTIDNLAKYSPNGAQRFADRVPGLLE